MISEPLNTINGSSALDCDSLASLLSERIDYLSLYGPLCDALEKNHFSAKGLEGGRAECQLEVEVRLGTVQNVRSEQRFSLPLTTDTLVSTRAPVKFVPGVTEEQYNSFKNLISEVADQEKNKDEWTKKPNVSTINRFFEIPGYEELVRISVQTDNAGSKTSKDAGFESIRKVNLLKWNISSGSNQESEESEEYAQQDLLDFRIAVNLEYKVQLASLPTTSNAKHCRKRLRDSYISKPGKVRFDLSKVEEVTETKGHTSSQSSTYEIEIELIGEEIVSCLRNKALDSSERLNRLKYHCATLVKSARYVRDFLCSRDKTLKYGSYLNAISEKVGLYDLRIASQDEEAVKRYKAHLSPQMPLIGDYMFRTVAHYVENNPDSHKGRKSLYSEHLGKIPGPFAVKLDEQGRKTSDSGVVDEVCEKFGEPVAAFNCVHKFVNCMYPLARIPGGSHAVRKH
ncbi:mRNA capping enzyme subunit [Theileria orientalis strain Shintoku]|uniref:mRNA 5'-phosphatase n=1 Tax=Theileria orientalis strain Shintoku TaxID=869250 RepID=J7MGU5_THEOR|nr:mRNA capping enzyme subunit [Theileria orientalis strain Shintoku]PVC52279.1 mRNA capping enzyme subunit [Theileria orientalis]BAM38771.1 mRNA capping enzyme subunit [Theileria orientalis strain Shintoku]|eukprot:XP_009689072.1 mRNA capping enzyme subunit [Theileria orientalis strain Shintoku]